MNVLVIGGTGYVGTAVVDELVAGGHRVAGLARSDETAARLAARGIVVVRGDLRDPASVKEAAAAADAVVHAGAPLGPVDDVGAVEAVLLALGGTRRRFVYTTGAWVLGPTGSELAGEDSPVAPLPIVSWRAQLEDTVLRAADDGVTPIVLRPAIVHGRGGGIPGMLVDWARRYGSGRWVGGSEVRWPFVDVDDLALLYRLALEGGTAGTVLHGVAEPAVAMAAVAAAADLAAGGSGAAHRWTVEEAADVVGRPLAEALGCDHGLRAENALALGWRPSRPGIIQDLVAGSYRSSPGGPTGKEGR